MNAHQIHLWSPTSWGTMTSMTGPLVIVGVPTALGGHLSGMETTPAGLRALGLAAALAGRPGLAGRVWRDAGDLTIEPGFSPDRDPRAKNRAAIAQFLPARARSDRDRGRGRLGGGAPAHPRWRLHRACRGDGRPPRRPARATPGDRLVRRTRRLQHARTRHRRATSGGCPSRCSAVVAIRIS